MMQPPSDNSNSPTPQLPAMRSDLQVADDLAESTSPQSSFPIRRVLKCLLKFWWLPSLTLLIGLGTAAVFVRLKPPTYVSTGSFVEAVKLRLPDGGLYEDAQNAAGTQTELLKSRTLADLTVAQLINSSNGVAAGADPIGGRVPVEIRVTAASKSSLYVLQATSSKQAYTQAYLDALMSEYLEYRSKMRKLVSGDTLHSISEELQSAGRDLDAAKDILIAFERTNNFVRLQEEGAMAGGSLTQLRAQLWELELQKQLLQGSLEAVAGGVETNSNLNGAAVVGPDSGTSLMGSGERKGEYQKLEALKMQRERLSRDLRPMHPKIVKLDEEIQLTSRMLEIYHRQNRDELLASLQGVLVKIERVEAEITKWQSKVIEAKTRVGEAERLRDNVKKAQDAYDRLDSWARNVGISRNIDQETLQILERASPARRTYSEEIRLVGLGTVGGFGLGLAIILLIALRDDRFTSPVEIGEKVGQIIVGQVPAVEGLGADNSPDVLQLDDPRHVYSESFRNLRSALMFMPGQAGHPQVLLVTSAVPNEGKSTVAVNLARALAFGGSRVLLVDGDLRKGVLHKLIKLQRGPGLAEALASGRDFRDVVQSNCIANLDFIGTGLIARHSGDLLLDRRFDEMMVQWRQDYNYVVLDSSPVFATDDATTLAPKVDGTLFVVRNGYSRLGQVKQALEQLYLRNAKVLGVVFNQADNSDRSYYYKYAEYYSPAPAAKT
jgi:polysaccharide biosynthesis transport protein